MIKVICIKDSNGFSLPHYSIKKGEFYSCKESTRYKNCYQVNIVSDDFEDMLYIGLFYKSNFLTLAEWREQQINSILDE
jgi:hypothetical protein